MGDETTASRRNASATKGRLRDPPGRSHQCAVLALLMLASVTTAGCVEPSPEGCGGTGETIAAFSGNLTPERPANPHLVQYNGSAPGLAVGITWNVSHGFQKKVRVRLDPHGEWPELTVNGFTKDRRCQSWEPVPAGNYTLMTEWVDESGDGPAEAISPEEAIAYELTVQPADQPGFI